MVETLVDRCESGTEIGKVLHPPGFLINVARYVHFDTIGMTMQARAFVICGYVWQPVRCLEAENLENVHLSVRVCLSLMQSVYRSGDAHPNTSTARLIYHCNYDWLLWFCKEH